MVSAIYKQVKDLFKHIDISNQKGNPNDIAHDPSIACRFGTLQNGIVGGNIPPCADGSSKISYKAPR